ncbi:MAG TPA: 3-keto-5-aminohexanoate cleavage protein [Solirubrobacterales bacterium]|nr:3-keto-5-aminohexanoate cleavage protein [Solirubrobacterales bacterium]
MASAQKTIISCAITGAIHVPAQTPHLPLTPDEIAEQAIGDAEAGAAILHLHARDPETGHPSGDPEIFAEFLPTIRAHTDAVINITTGGALGTSLEERAAAAVRFSPELCSMNIGSMNFGIFPMAATISEFKNDWEPGYLEMTKDFIFRNTFADVEKLVEMLGANGTRFEFECYDVGHIYNLAHFLERGIVEPPLFVQSVMGILGGIGTHPEDLIHMKRTADRLLGDAYHRSVLGAGRHQVRLTTTAALLGANVRVGLEDSIYLRKGVLAESNAQQVERTVRILDELSLEPATADEARQMLDLEGAAATSL